MTDNNISLGSEYAELDTKLSEAVIHHPVSDQVDGPFPAIVFGDAGMGKTAAALLLVKKYQTLAMSYNREAQIFPVYAPFEVSSGTPEWLVEKVSRAIIDFTADNPRRFLNAPDAQKIAMGRLMIWSMQNTDALRLHFYSSPFKSVASDVEQMLDYITKLQPKNSDVKLTKEEAQSLLYLAHPDAFNQVYFLWDIRSSDLNDEVVRNIKEVAGLALTLARENLFIKIFAPLTAKEPLGKLVNFRFIDDLVWNEFQLRELIAARIKMFEALWERGIDDPVELVVSAADRSPRRVIRFLVALFDYVDKHLQERQKLNKAIFDEVVSTLQF